MSEAPEPDRARVRLRVFLFLPWGEGIEATAEFLARVRQTDPRQRVTRPEDERLVRMARLDLDWHGETARCFGALDHPAIEFLPGSVVGPTGLARFLESARVIPAEERWCLAFIGQHPQRVGPAVGRLGAALRSRGVAIFYYAYDEASRTMPCFGDLAPHLDVLIHDEEPLSPAAARMGAASLALHRSWVANVLPFATPFEESPEERIVFLGSEMGLTPHRRLQLEFLRGRLGDRIVVLDDHSVAVGDRGALRRFKAALCPEGRKFTTPAMAASHTDRPFWCGCLGMMPVSENSQAGNRLAGLAADGLLLRYSHGDLDGLAAACDQALAAGPQERRRIYEHYNREETVGRVVADALAAFVRGKKYSWPP